MFLPLGAEMGPSPPGAGNGPLQDALRLAGLAILQSAPSISSQPLPSPFHTFCSPPFIPSLVHLQDGVGRS